MLFCVPFRAMNVSIAKEEVKRRKAPCRPALVSTGHNHSDWRKRRLTGPKWREGLRENTFDRTRFSRPYLLQEKNNQEECCASWKGISMICSNTTATNKALWRSNCANVFPVVVSEAVG